MTLEIISPDSTLFSGEIIAVNMPGVMGYFEIFQQHAPLVSILNSGKIVVKKPSGEVQSFDILSGIAEVSLNVVKVAVEVE